MPNLVANPSRMQSSRADRLSGMRPSAPISAQISHPQLLTDQQTRLSSVPDQISPYYSFMTGNGTRSTP